ncbi:rhodanese-like domain-containing protein [Saxibacter everestensis]|uniref:Rhodanese-like domain-containing protein n=1 Tax=Saxibacter everestensis TaxID=2909229 RepID=A0ABY8QQH3_9MICO|nr:rhodanese-like domain-containing protein [Brevibacteriaceae bacterium ZFBP1038]
MNFSDVPSVKPADVPEGTAIVDVREDDEWQAGHIEGAQHIPLGQLMERYGEVPIDDEVVVVCRSGGRSARAVQWLNANGFDAVNLSGGMGAWSLDCELPIVSDGENEPTVL